MKDVIPFVLAGLALFFIGMATALLIYDKEDTLVAQHRAMPFGVKP